MLSLLDIAERMQKGPKLDEMNWNMGLFHTMNNLTKKYELYYPKDSPVFNMDATVVDRAWEAAMEFLVGTGIYCITTGRVLQFSERELLDIIKAMPKEFAIGEGKDRRVIKKRRIEEKEGLNHCPGLHSPYTEELAPSIVRNFAQIPTADYLEGFNFAVVDGREIFGLPMEVYAAKREASWMRRGINEAGRPGMGIVYYPINTRAPVMIAPIDREVGLRPTDGILLSMLPDIKVEQDYLAAAIVWGEYGGVKLNGNGWGLVGDFAGGLGGCLIEAIVQTLAAWIVYRDVGCPGGVRGANLLDADKTIPIRMPEIWATSVYAQAIHKYTNHIITNSGFTTSGPGTRTHLWEVAYRAVSLPINGANVYHTRQLRTELDAGQSPLDAMWAYEVATTVMKNGFDRQRAGDLVLKIAGNLKGKHPEERYKNVREFYDLTRNRPLPEFEKIYLEVKEELSAMGLNFK
ncbi:monomethylamine:corrinoid methyltransferase [Chloroflexota bacterium]